MENTKPRPSAASEPTILRIPSSITVLFDPDTRNYCVQTTDSNEDDDTFGVQVTMEESEERRNDTSVAAHGGLRSLQKSDSTECHAELTRKKPHQYNYRFKRFAGEEVEELDESEMNVTTANGGSEVQCEEGEVNLREKCKKRLATVSNLVHTGEKTCQFAEREKPARDLINCQQKRHYGIISDSSESCSKDFEKHSHFKNKSRRHMREKPYPCPHCVKGFMRLGPLKRHLIKHTGENAQCEESFNLSEYLKTHRMTYTREKPHACAQCGKRFVQLGQLKVHLMTHTGEKPHACAQCGKRFTQSGQLKNHLVTHTGEKPHACAECGKGFGLLGQLKRHLMMHTEEKPRACAQCGKRFTLPRHLEDHLMTHSGEKPHACSQCGKRFVHLRGMERHLIMHQGEVPHVCAQCGKKFINSGRLKDHLMTHTGQKPHACALCGKSFTRAHVLKRHMVMHTEKLHIAVFIDERGLPTWNI